MSIDGSVVGDEISKWKRAQGGAFMGGRLGGCASTFHFWITELGTLLDDYPISWAH